MLCLTAFGLVAYDPARLIITIANLRELARRSSRPAPDGPTEPRSLTARGTATSPETAPSAPGVVAEAGLAGEPAERAADLDVVAPTATGGPPTIR